MAMVSAGFKLTVTLKDNGDNTSRLTYALNSADYTEAATDRAAILAALANVTDAVVESANLSEVSINDAFAYPAVGIHVEDRAKVVCAIDSSERKSETVYVPAPKIGLFSNSSGEDANIIDPTDSDLLTYLGLWSTTGGVATLSDGETLKDSNIVRSGGRVHRQSSFG